MHRRCGSGSLSIGPDTTAYAFDLTAPSTTTTASVALLAGSRVGEVIVDDVSLVELP